MAEDIKGLIEKIQKEGIAAGEDKAKDIENQARQRAKEIIEDAREQAGRMVAQAQAEAAKLKSSGETALKQAGRDLLLSLRKEINAMLQKLIITHTRQALTPAQLTRIIADLVKRAGAKKPTEDIIVTLNKKDLETLGKSFLNKLKDAAKKEIRLKAQDDIRAGFLISYDSGKSHYDFSDQGLAEYIGSYIKPELDTILKQAVSGDKKAKKSGK